jgi:hypothetical protein
MKWFDKWFAKKCKQAWESPRDESMEEEKGYTTSKGAFGLSVPNRVSIAGKTARVDEGLRSYSTNFALYNANGGTVVELRSYNENTDRNQNVLYVIPSDKDLGQELGHIVTMEALKR